MKERQILIGVLSILLVVAIGLLIGVLQKPAYPVTAMDLPASVPTQAPTKPPSQPCPATVSTSDVKIKTYWYRVDEYGHAIWRQAGEIPAGALVNRGPCLADGYAQVEYPDPGRPNWWLVQFVKCEG